MHVKRWLSLAVVMAAAAVLITTAGAAQRPSAKAHLSFKTPAAVLNYLRAQGVNIRGLVVQRGSRNYAGPKCPGRRWNCTKSRRVVQFAATTDSTNSFVCSPAGTGTTPPNSCMIVQAAPLSGDNNAKCVEQSSADPVTQECSITQTNVAGANNAVVFQLITQGTQMPNGQQNADIKQTNGTGKNNALLAQTIYQSAATNSLTVGQNQQGQQTNTINQSSGTGSQASIMAQTVVQKATAGSSEEEDSSYTPFAAAAFTGSQTQYGDGTSDTTQNSGGVSQAFNFQNMLQSEWAPRFSAVSQSQNGPFRCCTQQQVNPNDVFSIQQSKLQFTSSVAASQFLDQLGELETTGHGHIIQFDDQNGTTQSNSCDVNNGPCVAEETCTRGTEGGGCSPPTSCNNFSCAGECFPNGCSPIAAAARSAPAARLNRYLRSARLRHHFH